MVTRYESIESVITLDLYVENPLLWKDIDFQGKAKSVKSHGKKCRALIPDGTVICRMIQGPWMYQETVVGCVLNFFL